MARQVQLRRGTTAQHAGFTGAVAEVTVDTDKNTLLVHDGSTAGGIELLKKAALDSHLEEDVNDGDIPHIGMGGVISHESNTGEKSTPETRVLIACSSSKVSSNRGSVMGGTRNEVAGIASSILASNDSKVTGGMSAIIASQFAEASGNNSAIISSGINANYPNENTGNKSLLVCSRSTKNEDNRVFVGGYSAVISIAKTSNRKFVISAQTGNIEHAGTISTGHSFTDFAEVFPNLTEQEQGYGLLQTIEGFGVRPAQEGERAVGVTSATAGVILGDTPFSWQGRWLKDEWGAYIYETIPDMGHELKNGETEEDRPLIAVPKENPEWDSEVEQVSRLDRPDEWTVVGLLGQVYVRLKEDVDVGDFVKAWQDGVGQKSAKETNVQVMKITQEYDENKGYKIGFCLLK